MGLADIFSSSTSNPPPVPPKNAVRPRSLSFPAPPHTHVNECLPSPPLTPRDEQQMGVDRDKEKDEIIRRLTEELMRTRERNHQLEKDLPALAAAKAAVERARELEDVLRLKDIMVESLERQVALLEKYNAALQQKEAELVALRAEQVEQPISQPDLLHRYEQLCDIFGQLRDTLTCPVCYEPFDKDQAVSLLCGHSFCATCYAEWERKHIEAFKLSPRQGQYTGPECPECRTADVRRGRVRIWSLEEVVRLVDRANREIANKPYTPSVPPVEPLTAADLLLADEGAVGEGGAAVAVGTLIEFEAEAVGDVEKKEAQKEEEEEVRTGDSAAMDVDPPSPSAAPESLDAPDPPSPAQPASASSPRTPSPPLPPAPTTPASPASPSLEQQYLLDLAAARARERAESARLERLRQEEEKEREEREAREAREQVLRERRRMPYGAVIR